MTTETLSREAAPAPAPAPEPARPRRRGALVVGVVAVVVVAVLPLLDLSVPGVLPGATWTPGTMHLIALCMIFAAVALTYHLVYGVAGMLSFGHALYFAAGAYGLAIVLQRSDLPLLVACALVLVGVIVLANVVGAISLRVSGVSFAMVTLAFAQAGNVIARRNMWGATGGEEGIGLTTVNVPDALVGVVNTRNMYWLALALLVVVYAVVTWVQSSRAGHVVEATRENELRVRVLGQAPYLIRLMTFAIAGALAGLVGMVYLLLQSQAVPTISGADFTIEILIMVVLGGVGSRWGAIVGAVTFTMLNQRLSVLASSEAVESLPTVLHVPLSEPAFILGVLFILVVLFLPGGIAGGLRRAAAGLARGTGGAGRRAARERRRLEEVA
ncbi:MAG TPA: branched-chain amino acid ABC transporter permease [Phototrophicaceae bacterium]|nr:branched-chain amino acid ABC transporter permease [Phototrophicaceae bacterium]